METVGTILDLINKYGVPIVLLVWLLWWILKKGDEVIKYLFGKVDKASDTVKKQANLMSIFEINSEVNEMLSQIVARYGTSYATLWQFHNGEMTIGGVPFVKISATHQKCKSNCFSWASRYQNVPTSFFADCIQEGIDLLEVDVDDVSKNDAIRGVMKILNIRKAYLFSVTDSKGGLIGVLTITFRNDSVCLSTDEINELREYADRAAIHLERLTAYGKLENKE